MGAIFLFLGALSACIAVAMGAFGAHGLGKLLDDRMRAVYQTAVQYHLWHSLGLMLLANLARQHPNARLLHWAGWLMLAGMLLFSGSLYVLSVSGSRWLGAVTPFGGTLFLAAWILVALFAVKYY